MGAELAQQDEPLQFVDDQAFEESEAEETHRTLNNNDIELQCLCSGANGRNLVVCIDGTANQFSTQVSPIALLHWMS